MNKQERAVLQDAQHRADMWQSKYYELRDHLWEFFSCRDKSDEARSQLRGIIGI